MEREAHRIGYPRVSTEDQNLSLQLDALKAAGCNRIFADEGISGFKARRPALDEALRGLRPGEGFCPRRRLSFTLDEAQR
jgi:DNA invertase Pin-like site-specific DNA recombinase